jgi:hypothetical protein
VCLYRPAGGSSGKLSPYFSAQFRGASGKVVSVGTKLRDRKLAKRLEAVWVRASETARNGHLTSDRAKQLLAECAEISRGDSLKQSEAFLDGCLRQSTGVGLNIPTVERYFTDWVQAKRELGRNSLSTLAKYEPVLTRFVQHLPEARRRSPLASITPLDCAGFLRSELSRGISPVSANQNIKILRTVFGTARRQGLLTMNPGEAVDLPHEEPERRQAFALDQVRLILAVADEEWRGIILMGLYAGMRLGDATRLTWGNIDLDANVVRFVAQKTARRKAETIVDLHRDLLSYLKSLQPGVPGVPIELRMALAGHSSDAMSLGYTHVNRSLTAAAIAALPSVERAA